MMPDDSAGAARPANQRRGEVEAVIGGEPVRLCLTLGALAELESAFGASDLGALGERFAQGRLGARDLAVILACAMRGAGRDVSEREVAALPLAGGLGACIAAVAELLAVTFGCDPEAVAAGEPGPFGARRD